MAYLGTAGLIMDSSHFSEPVNGYSANFLATAIYNFRHGMELFHKFLLDGTGAGVPKMHDISYLLNSVYPLTLTKKQKIEAIKNLELELDENEFGEFYSSFQKRYEELYKRYTMGDKDNTSCRYPNIAKLEELKLFTEDDINILRNDVKFAKEFQKTFLALHSDFIQKLNDVILDESLAQKK